MKVRDRQSHETCTCIGLIPSYICHEYKQEKIDYDTIDSFHRRCSFVA